MNKRKKVCILQNGLARGGTDTFVVNLCRGLDKNKFDITVVNPSNDPGSLVREPDVLKTGSKIIHTTPLTGVGNKIKHLYQLYRILKKEKFDIFQTNIDLFNGPNLMVAWLAGVPLRCCHSHNGMQNKELDEGQSLSIRLYQYSMRWMCNKFSNRKCGCSEEAMDFLYPGFDRAKLKYPYIINNGIDINHFKEPINKEKKLRELGLKDKKYILTIGHLISQKNPLFITEAFVKLCKERDDVDLLWIGDGILKNDVLKILDNARILDRVHFLGYRNDINEIMKCANIFILPSTFEGLGIVAIEAQAAGLPCLLSDQVPQKTDCGGAEYLPINKRTDIWVEEINAILDNRKILKAEENRLKDFSIERMAEQMTKVFES